MGCRSWESVLVVHGRTCGRVELDGRVDVGRQAKLRTAKKVGDRGQRYAGKSGDAMRLCKVYL
jgi:hypothetical protein